MTLDDFTGALTTAVENDRVTDFCRSTILHGTPHVFRDREDDLYSFKRRICEQYNILHTEIFIVGSAKLGFSPFKGTEFSLDSDVDVSIVSSDLFRKYREMAGRLEFRLRRSEVSLTTEEMKRYTKLNRNFNIGWARPDLLPAVTPCIEFKEAWFDFFRSLSYKRSEVGNYKVSAGVFESHLHLEAYTEDSVKSYLDKIAGAAQ